MTSPQDLHNLEPVFEHPDSLDSKEDPKCSIAETVAYHETGHLIMNILVRQLELQANIPIAFSRLSKICINSKLTSGKVVFEQIGVPVFRWEEYNRGLPDLPDVDGYKFFREFPDFAIAKALGILAGHMFETFHCRNSKFNNLVFGEPVGEKMITYISDNSINTFGKD